MSIKTALFINETDLPIEVSGLIQVMIGLNKLDCVIVMPNEKCTIRSLTGEWFLSSMFNDTKYRVMWAREKMACENIGKFRNTPCIQGEYSWMDTEKFIVTYDGNDVFKFSYYMV